MTRILLTAFLAAAFAAAPSAFGPSAPLGLSGSALAMCQSHCISDGAAKGQANEGTFHPQTDGQLGMAVKGSGVPQNGRTKMPGKMKNGTLK
jgi:hypothetical protein